MEGGAEGGWEGGSKRKKKPIGHLDRIWDAEEKLVLETQMQKSHKAAWLASSPRKKRKEKRAPRTEPRGPDIWKMRRIPSKTQKEISWR